MTWLRRLVLLLAALVAVAGLAWLTMYVILLVSETRAGP